MLLITLWILCFFLWFMRAKSQIPEQICKFHMRQCYDKHVLSLTWCLAIMILQSHNTITLPSSTDNNAVNTAICFSCTQYIMMLNNTQVTMSCQLTITKQTSIGWPGPQLKAKAGLKETTGWYKTYETSTYV